MRDYRASSGKSKVLLADIEVLKKNEIQRRRALRLLQVRQQCKDIASQIRERCKDERNKQLHLYNLESKEEVRESEMRRLALLQQQYQKCLSCVGQSHRDAAAQPDPEMLMTEERERWKKAADKRGKVASKRSRVEAAELVKKQQDAERQRNFVRTVENIRSSVVASLPKKMSWSSEKSKSKEEKTRKAPLRDVNKMVGNMPSHITMPTCPDVPLLQGITSHSGSPISLVSLAQQPQCIERFVNKLVSRLATHGTTASSISTHVSQLSDERSHSISTLSSHPTSPKFVHVDKESVCEQEKILRLAEQRATSMENVVVDIALSDGMIKDPVHTTCHTDEEPKTSSHGRSHIVRDVSEIDGIGERILEERNLEQLISQKDRPRRLGMDTEIEYSSQPAMRNLENTINNGEASPREDMLAVVELFSHYPTVQSDIELKRGRRSRSVRSLDIIEEEESIEGQNKQETEEANAMEPGEQKVEGHMSRRLSKMEDEKEFLTFTEYVSEEIHPISSTSQNQSSRVQLYDHTHRFIRDYDASHSISVTRVIQNSENDARTEASVVESVAAAATATAEASTHMSTNRANRGREALRRAHLERQYQSLIGALGPLSREERISRAVAGVGGPVEAHLSYARLKKRHTEHQLAIATAFENLIEGKVEALGSIAPTLPSPLWDISQQPQVSATETVPATDHGNGVKPTTKEYEIASPVAALNVGTWAPLPVTANIGLTSIIVAPSPKPSSSFSAEDSLVLAPPPPPAVPSTVLSAVGETAQPAGEQSVETRAIHSTETETEDQLKTVKQPTSRPVRLKESLQQKTRSPPRAEAGPARRTLDTQTAPLNDATARASLCWCDRLSHYARADDSGSTMYLSPPDTLPAPASADLASVVDSLHRRRSAADQGPGSNAPLPPAALDPMLERYILHLLSMSKESIEALNVSSSDVSVRTEVLEHPNNVLRQGNAATAETVTGTTAWQAPPATQAPVLELAFREPPLRRSVAVAVTPEQLCPPIAPRYPCAPCAPCAQPVATPCSPYAQQLPTLGPRAPPASDPAAESARPATTSPEAPLDTTEYLQHELFTLVGFRRVPASVPPADPALPHDSPHYRSLSAPKVVSPLRVGGGAPVGDTSPSPVSDDLPVLAALPVTEAERDAAWRSVAANVAELSERCSRRIQSLTRLIEHVRLEKSHLAHLEGTTDGLPPAPSPTRAHSPEATRIRSPSSPPPPRMWNVPAESTTASGAPRPETWQQILEQQVTNIAANTSLAAPQTSPRPPSRSPPHSPSHLSPRSRPHSPQRPVMFPPHTRVPVSSPDTVPISRLHTSPARTYSVADSIPDHLPNVSPVWSLPKPAASTAKEDTPLWVFPPPPPVPCSAPCATERVRSLLRPKPPPSAWRPGVPYIEQHELSAIPEADTSQSALAGDFSEHHSPLPHAHTAAAPAPPFREVVGDPATICPAGPREILHDLLVATHQAAQRVQPWSLEYRPGQSAPLTSNVPSPRVPSPRATSPRATSPGATSPSASSPHATSPRAHSPEQHHAGTLYEDEPNIVEELMRRGVLKSPFSWMKSAGADARAVDVDLDVSLVSGASSDFVSDLLLSTSASSSTPRRAQTSNASDSNHVRLRQRGGADQSVVTAEAATIQLITDELRHDTSGGNGDDCATSNALPEDLEGMFQRLGLGWAAAMLRKTQEAMAISSSSSEASRGAPLAGAGAGATGGGSISRRGHSTPADPSGASDASGSASWSRGQVLFTGDSDMSSVPGTSSRDLSSPSVSLVINSKNKNDS